MFLACTVHAVSSNVHIIIIVDHGRKSFDRNFTMQVSMECVIFINVKFMELVLFGSGRDKLLDNRGKLRGVFSSACVGHNFTL